MFCLKTKSKGMFRLKTKFEKVRFHQQKCRTIIQIEKELSKSLPSQFEPDPTNLDMSINDICRRSSVIIQFMATELASCPIFHTHKTILEHVFTHENIVHPYMCIILVFMRLRHNYILYNPSKQSWRKWKLHIQMRSWWGHVHYLKLLWMLILLAYMQFHKNWALVATVYHIPLENSS